MNILYVILSSAKTKERRKYQEDSWIKYIGEGDLYLYLDSVINVADTYENVPYKYSQFIKSYKSFDKFDWVLFCDDDTFIYPKRLHHLLRYFKQDEPLIIGRTGNYKGWECCSGGAGFAISRYLILKIKKYISDNTHEMLPNSDTSLCMWAKLAEPLVKFIDRMEQFQTQHLRHPDNDEIDIDMIISAHYCTEYDFKILSKHLKHF